MKDYHPLILQIRLGQEGKSSALESLYLDIELRKIALYVHGKYPRLAAAIPWEEVFYESLEQVLTELEKGKGPTTNFKGYFWKVCNGTCMKLLKKEDDAVDAMQIFADYVKDSDKPELRAKVIFYLEQLDEKWRVLLWKYYMEEPPVKNYELLEAALNELKDEMEKKVDKKSIPTLLSRAREQFRKLLNKHRDELFD